MSPRFFRNVTVTVLMGFVWTQSYGDNKSCEEIRAIYAASKTDFKVHRTGSKKYDDVAVWDTDLTLANQNCQVWQWGKDQASFICTRVFPTRQAGSDFLRKAKKTVKRCLATEVALPDDVTAIEYGFQMKVKSKDDKRQLDIFLMENNLLMHDSWTFYFVMSGANGQNYPRLKSSR